ncbi:MAG: DUF92 domain-containing protein [Bacteroidota bacterium]
MEFILAGLVLTFVLLAEALKRTGIVDPVFARKILHIGAISVSAFSVYFIQREVLLWIIGICIPLLLAAVLLGFFRNEESGRRSYGIVYFAIAFFALTFLFATDAPHLVYYPLMILAWSDGMATVVGYRSGNQVLPFSEESKTIEGSLTFFIVTSLVLGLSGMIPTLEIPELSFCEILLITLFLSIVEMLSSKSLDNLWVPAAAVYWLMIDFTVVNALFIFLIPLLAFLAFWKKTLTLDGAFGAALLGWIFLLNPEPIIIVLPATFFLVGSILSKLPSHVDESSNRDSVQVFSNGLIPAICFMIYFLSDENVFLIAGISGFAFALSDTSSSEIGVRIGGKHFNISNGKLSAEGVSGAITLAGSLAGVFFSLLMGVLAYFIFSDFGWVELMIITVAGIMGNLVDSLIGSFFQAKYQSTEGELIEAGTDSSTLVRGYRWIDNSMTNLLSSIISCLLGLLLAALI